MKKRFAGPPIILTSVLQIAIEVTVTNGFGTYTTTGLYGGGYGSIPAGEYSIFDFADLVAQKIAAYLFADLNAAGSLPTITGTVADVHSYIELTTQNPTRNGTTFSFRLDQLNAVIGGAAAPITAVKLKNTSSPAFPALLGLGIEGTDVNCTINAGDATAVGLFQPRAVYCAPRSEIFLPSRGGAEIYSHIKLSSGEVAVWSVASQFTEQEYQFVDLDASLCGPPHHVGNLSSVSAGLLTLSFPNPTLTNRLTNTGQHGLQTDRITVGQYVYIPRAGDNGFVSRVASVTANAAPTQHTIGLCEKVPYSFSEAAPVFVVGDLWAMKHDAYTRAKGHWLLFGANDTDGGARFTPDALVIIGDGKRLVNDLERRDLGMDRYTLRIPTVRPSKSYLTQVTT